MVKIPQTIKIGGYDYLIIIDKKSTDDLRDRDRWGEHSGMQRTIRISGDCSPQQLSSTFLHELLHAVDNVYNSACLEDKEIAGLANGLMQVTEQLQIKFTK